MKIRNADFLKIILVFSVSILLAGCRSLTPTSQPMTEVTPQQKITQANNLLDADGNLLQAGWSPRPLLNYNPEKINKDRDDLREWEFFTVLTEDYAMNFTIAKLDFASFCSVDYLDFKNQEMKVGAVYELGIEKLITFGDGKEKKTVCIDGDDIVMSYETLPGKRIITYDIPGTLFTDNMAGKITLTQPVEMDYLSLVTPFNEGKHKFFHEQKIPNMPAEGTAVVDEMKINIAPGTAFAVMDWGRGVWADDLMWRWGSASGYMDGKVVGFNIGNGFGNMSAASENLIVYDGVGHKIDQVIWEYDEDDYMKPWRFKSNDGRLDLILEPVYHQKMGVDVIFKYGRLNKSYGHFSGQLILDDGTKVTIDRMMGFAEEVFIGW